MNKLVNEKVEVISILEYENGFRIEICPGNNGYVDYHLVHKDYGEKMFMFGIKEQKYEDYVEIANGNIDEYIEIYKKEYMDCEEQRICSECGKHMNEGYCIDSGAEYYCSDECLHKHYTEEEWNEMYDNGDGDSYWTEWED